MAAFKFPQTFVDRGRKWHLQYEPGNMMTMLPSMENGKVTGVVCDPMQIPGGQTVHVVRVDITLPGATTGGRVVGERHLRGIRTFAVPPVDPGAVPPQEMAFYLEEPTTTSGTTETQSFMLSLLGVAMEEREPDIDTSWPDQMLGQLRAGQKADEPEKPGA